MQVAPGSVSFVSGADALACMQQTPKGAFRWVAACCATPLGLTLPSPRVPFVGLNVHRIDTDALRGTLDDALGPLRARVNTKLKGAQAWALRADTASLLRMLAHLTPLTLRWWWRGEHRRSPFFDARTGKPAAPVERLYTQLPSRVAGCR